MNQQINYSNDKNFEDKYKNHIINDNINNIEKI